MCWLRPLWRKWRWHDVTLRDNASDLTGNATCLHWLCFMVDTTPPRPTRGLSHWAACSAVLISILFCRAVLTSDTKLPAGGDVGWECPMAEWVGSTDRTPRRRLRSFVRNIHSSLPRLTWKILCWNLFDIFKEWKFIDNFLPILAINR